MTNTLRSYWRPIFCAAVLIVSFAIPFFARPTIDRTDALRFTLVGMWLALALLHALLALTMPAPSRGWRIHDILSVAVLIGLAWYEARWPGSLPNSTPERIAGPWAAAGLGGALTAGRSLARQGSAEAREA
ncbi:MAG TPA: hypothetical protein VFZ20_29050 [Longimicrobium sp.]|nr:hypothetical protein [Longimicrobium sp.]